MIIELSGYIDKIKKAMFSRGYELGHRDGSYSIKDMCVDGLCTDGGHHKQWFLEQILLRLGFDIKQLKKEAWDEIEDPDDGYSWKDGIAP